MMQAQQLMNAYFDGDIASTEAAQLSDWLKADPANMRAFAEFGLLHARLRDHFSVKGALESMPRRREVSTRFRIGTRTLWWMASAAVVAAALTIVTFLFLRDGATSGPRPSAVPPFTRGIPAHYVIGIQDLLTGGNGLGIARDGGVDVIAGKLVSAYNSRLGRVERLGLPVYVPILAGPVDGCFTPNGVMAVDSLGDSFAFPTTTAEACGVIWAGPQVHEARMRTQLADVEYSASPHSSLLIPSNSGITFDLDAIRQMHPKMKLNTFKAVVGNSYVGDRNPPKADVYVLLDGKSCFEKRGFTNALGAFAVECALSSHNRFLTLASTDGGDSTVNDWIVWGDSAIDAQLMQEP